jgi:hypothetical protein
MNLGRTLKRFYRSLPVIRELRALRRSVDRMDVTMRRAASAMLQAQLNQDPRYSDPIRLLRYAAQTFSQNGEDGMVAEIFRRIGTGACEFVEIGAGNGLENNTVMWLAQGWKGWWFEGDRRAVGKIRRLFRKPLESNQLVVSASAVTAENIAGLMTDLKVPAEFDLLSIDIDRNTYWVWAALTAWRPRVAVVEYNSVYPPGIDWKAEYRAGQSWNGTAYFGASLKAYELLGRRLGYSLVGCDFMGVNAFFVRNDLCGARFAAPFTAENHYEPPRYNLRARMGHPPGFSDLP